MNQFKFESFSVFIDSLEEVDFLISQAFTSNPNYTTYIKSSILLLTTKFEKFLEDIVDEYIAILNSLTVTFIPDDLKINSSIFLIEKTKQILNLPHKKNELKSIILDINNLWKENYPVDKLQISNKFNYGKHGSEDMANLFYRIGIDNIFSEIIIFEEEEEESYITSVSSNSPIDFKKKFNSLVAVRNNVVHTDSSPGLSSEDMKKNKLYLSLFARELNKNLICRVNSIIKINSVYNI